MQRHALPAQLGQVLLWGSAAMLASTQASAQQAPILDLNSGPSLISLVEHGDFSQTNTWSATGKWRFGTDMACTFPPHQNDTPSAGPHMLNAPPYTGWDYGPSNLGGARISLEIGWTDGVLSSEQNVLTVNLDATPYATITTSAGAGDMATVTYQNGATGNLTVLPASAPFTSLVLNLPTSVPTQSNLAFSYTGEESATTDRLCIRDVVAQGYRDASPGRGNDVRFDEGDAPVALVGPAATISDADSSSVEGAMVNFSNLKPGDVVWFNGQVMTEVSAGVIQGLPYAVTAVGGGLTLRLTGPASGPAYITALQTLRFQPTASPLVVTPRVVNFEVNDGNSVSNTAVATVAINAKPVASNNAKTIDKAHSTAVTGNLLSDNDGNGVDADANGDAFALSSFAGLPVTAPVAHTGNYGSWTVNPDGSYSYQLDTSNPAVAALTRTQSLQDSATYRISELGAQTMNGSFENDFVPQGQPGWYSVRGQMPEDPTDPSDPYYPSTAGMNFSNSPDGGKLKVMIGNGYDPLGGNSVIQQTLTDLVPGSTYALTFYQTISSHNTGSIRVIPGHIQVIFGSEEQNSPTMTPPALGEVRPWDAITMNFTATATTQLLEIRGAPDGTGGWAMAAIDGVNLSRTSGTPLFGEATVTMTITGLNSAPTSAPASLSTPQNTPLSQTLPAATDVDGDTVTYAQGATAPLHGSLVVESDGTFVYTPTTGYSGTDSFSFVVSDGFGGSNEYSVAISIAANTNPVDGDEALTTGQGQTLTGNLLANASDADGDALSISAFTVNGQTYQPGQTASLANIGSLRVDGDGQFSFQPNAQFKGEVPEVGYTVLDARGGTDTSTLRITVTAAPASVKAVPLGGPLWAWLATALLAGMGLRRMRKTR